MKKLFLLLLVGFFAVVVAACSNLPTLESISIEGQDIEFYVGEDFNVGDLKVVAKLSDASTEDVTNQAKVSHNADMSKAGTYTVTVTYKDLTETYEITVIGDGLVSLAVENLKTEYFIGEELSFEGAVAKETFQSGKVADADLASYEVVIADSKGNEYTGAFAKLGKNTVKLSKGAVVYEFDVNVSANVYNTVEQAVAAGIKNSNKVSNGTVKIDYVEYADEYAYAFGDKFIEIQGPDSTDYYSLLEDGSVFGVVLEGNPYIEPAYEPLEDNLKGVDLRSVLNYAYDIFGVESFVETFAYVGQSGLALNYEEAKGENGSFNFSFEIIIEDFYYYFVEVSFVLDAESEVFTEVTVKMDGYMYVYNEETGEITQKRKSPKKGNPYLAFKELYTIRDFLQDPNFHVRLVLMDMEEYRLLNGWSRDKKRGSKRYDRLPLRLEDEVILDSPKDYLQFLPLELEETFTSEDLAKLVKIPRKLAGTVLLILWQLGLVERSGKCGRSYLYKIN